MLSDLGAEVIKVESPRGDQLRVSPPMKAGFSAGFTQFNAGKKSVCVDYRTERGIALVRQLAARSDIFLENFRAGLAEEIGLGYDAIRELNPAIVYCSISGFGQTGPDGGRTAYTDIIQALSGLEYAGQKLFGNESDSPPGYGASLADTCAGLNAAVAILAALYSRTVTGEGQSIDISMLDSLIASNDSTLQRTIFSDGELDAPSNIFRPPFRLSDGFMCASVGLNFEKVVMAMGRPELIVDDRFRTVDLQRENMVEYIQLVKEWLSGMSVEEASAIFDEYDIPYGKVNSSEEVLESPVVESRGMKAGVQLPDGEETAVINTPFHFSSGRSMPRGRPPFLGEHTDEVMRDVLELPADERRSLFEEGVLVSEQTGSGSET